LVFLEFAIWIAINVPSIAQCGPEPEYIDMSGEVEGIYIANMQGNYR
jgi:hypothetical protein